MVDPYTQALRNQVAALSKDCHYLISLLNTTDNIDWDGWPEGKAIMKDLERSLALLKMPEQGNQEQAPSLPVPARRNRPIHRQMPLPEPFNDPFFKQFFGNF